MPYLGSTPAVTALNETDIVDEAITSVKIVDDNVTLAKLAAGTDGNIISFDSSGDPIAIATGTSGHFLSSGGAGVTPSFAEKTAGYTITAEQATTSGTSVTFSNIPSGVQRVVIMAEGTSNNVGAGQNIGIQLGDSGGLETSGYIGCGGSILEAGTSAVTRSTSGFLWRVDASPAQYFIGAMNFFLKDVTNNTWVATIGGVVGQDADRQGAVGGGVKSLSAVLTQLKVFPLSGAFDAGSISVMYK